MSRAEAAGWARSSCQSVSVVPMIQCPPHGMTNSTELAVRRISPASPVIAERGTTRCTPLEARTRRPGRGADVAEHPRHVVAPHPGGGDDGAGAHLELRVRDSEVRRDPYPGHLARLADQPDGAGAGHHRRAEAGRGAGEGDHQPGVVDLRRRSSGSPRRSRPRAATGRAAGRRARVRCRCSGIPRPPPKPAAANASYSGHPGAVVGAPPDPAGAGSPVAAAAPGTAPAGPGAGASRVASRPRSVQRLVHQPELQLLQVAQATVDQLAGPAGGAGGEVTRLDQGDLEPARRGVEGGTGAGHPTADDQHVEPLAAQATQVRGARRTGESWPAADRDDIRVTHPSTVTAR